MENKSNHDLSFFFDERKPLSDINTHKNRIEKKFEVNFERSMQALFNQIFYLLPTDDYDKIDVNYFLSEYINLIFLIDSFNEHSLFRESFHRTRYYNICSMMKMNKKTNQIDFEFYSKKSLSDLYKEYETFRIELNSFSNLGKDLNSNFHTIVPYQDTIAFKNLYKKFKDEIFCEIKNFDSFQKFFIDTLINKIDSMFNRMPYFNFLQDKFKFYRIKKEINYDDIINRKELSSIETFYYIGFTLVHPFKYKYYFHKNKAVKIDHIKDNDINLNPFLTFEFEDKYIELNSKEIYFPFDSNDYIYFHDEKDAHSYQKKKLKSLRNTLNKYLNDDIIF